MTSWQVLLPQLWPQASSSVQGIWQGGQGPKWHLHSTQTIWCIPPQPELYRCRLSKLACESHASCMSETIHYESFAGLLALVKGKLLPCLKEQSLQSPMIYRAIHYSTDLCNAELVGKVVSRRRDALACVASVDLHADRWRGLSSHVYSPAVLHHPLYHSRLP